MKAIYARRGVCPCGFSLLADEIPLGTEYEVRPGVTERRNLYCGGCKQILRNLPCIFVEPRLPGQRGGFMVASIFEIDEGPAEAPTKLSRRLGG